MPNSNPIKGRKKFGADLTVIIPAAGIGKRMKSHGAKPLIELAPSESVLTRQLRIIKQVYPKAEIIVVVGFQADRLIKHLCIFSKVKVVENELYEESSVVRSIGMGLRVATHPNVLIIYGDLVFSTCTLNNLLINKSAIVVDCQNQMNSEEVGVNIVDNYVARFAYGLPNKWAHILFLNGKELELFKLMACDKTKKKLNTFEILNYVIDRGGKIMVLESKTMKVIEIDSFKDIVAAQLIK